MTTEKGGGILYTCGDSHASVNLIGSILVEQQFQSIRPKVFRILSKQVTALKALTAIPDKNTRETSLRMWHERFSGKVMSLPEVIQTHMRCIETGIYRKMLKSSKEGTREKTRIDYSYTPCYGTHGNTGNVIGFCYKCRHYIYDGPKAKSAIKAES